MHTLVLSYSNVHASSVSIRWAVSLYVCLTRTSLAVRSYLSAREGLAAKRTQSDATPAWNISAVALQPMPVNRPQLAVHEWAAALDSA